MVPYEDRFRMIEARCSAFAAELLRELRHHPKLAELLTELETIGGPIYRGDVEQALMRINKKA